MAHFCIDGEHEGDCYWLARMNGDRIETAVPAHNVWWETAGKIARNLRAAADALDTAAKTEERNDAKTEERNDG